MRKFYDAIFAGDWAGVEKCVSKKLIVYEADGLPYRGQYRGIEELKALFGQVVSYWSDLKFEVKGITGGDGYVVGVLEFGGTSKSTGRKISMPIAEVSEFEDGVIASIKPVYWDTKTIADAIG
jgi:ketosteroid isomerase-like protein